MICVIGGPLIWIVLDKGDKSHKSWKCKDYLNVDQLYRQVKKFERIAYLKILKESLHDSITVYGDSFLNHVFTIANVNAS